MKARTLRAITTALVRAKLDAGNDRATIDALELLLADELKRAHPHAFNASRFYSAAWTTRKDAA